MESFKEFVKKKNELKESVLQQQEIDINQFPNPVTGSLAKIFKDKGLKDGDKFDDIVEARYESIPAKDLKPSQEAIYLGKSLLMAIKGIEGGDLGSVISKDNYILDGHHRWAATMFNNPDAKIRGKKINLNIGDLIPVLRALGDAFGNQRRGEPKGGDVNIFDASINDAIATIKSGNNMAKQYYDKDEAIEWLNKKGEKTVQEALARIQSVPPPADALPRSEMPVIDADKGEVEKSADLLKKGKIDVRTPYSNKK